MLDKISLDSVLFLDIETVPAYSSFNELPENFQKLWEKKAAQIDKDKTPEQVYERAGIYAEFGKIICISVGFVFIRNGEKHARIKSFTANSEKELLSDFANLLHKYNAGQHILCAHNGKEFDFPYIARRMLINGIELPAQLDIAGRKPWEIPHLDTLELWKFGDYKSFTSLALLTAVFGIPSPKDDIDGSEVAKVFYQENNIKRIANYCQKDVLAIIQLLICYKLDSLIKPENIEFVE